LHVTQSFAKDGILNLMAFQKLALNSMQSFLIAPIEKCVLSIKVEVDSLIGTCATF